LTLPFNGADFAVPPKRRLIMRRIAILAVTAPIVLVPVVGNAQLSPSPSVQTQTSPAPTTEPARALPPAPVGHRQPRVGDVPNERDVIRNESDVELDRKLSICRGC
jgi:hypothetical protein